MACDRLIAASGEYALDVINGTLEQIVERRCRSAPDLGRLLALRGPFTPRVPFASPNTAAVRSTCIVDRVWQVRMLVGSNIWIRLCYTPVLVKKKKKQPSVLRAN